MVFVTGGTGLLGSYLLRKLLQEGDNIVALYRTHYSELLNPEEVAKIQWIKGEILDTSLLTEICAKATKVYHCAGMVSFNPSRRAELMETNVVGTTNIVNACIEGNVEKLVYVSSVAALGRKNNNQLISENAPWLEDEDYSVYGLSKYLAELEVWRGISEGLNAAIVNPTIILGVGNWNDSSAALFKNVWNEFPWFTDGLSGFVFAEDVAKVMVLLMNSDINAERFILSAENLPFQTVFNAMATQFKKKPPHLKVTPLLASIVWRLEKLKQIFTGKDPLLTKETAASAQRKTYYNNQKLLKAIPAFNYTSIEKTIEICCAGYFNKINH
jgi:nucleoside-diphosphate-sugar epimerase